MGRWRHNRRAWLILGLLACSGAVLFWWLLFSGTPMVRGFNMLNLANSDCQVEADKVAQRFIPFGSTEAYAKKILSGQGFKIWPEIPRAGYIHKESDRVLERQSTSYDLFHSGVSIEPLSPSKMALLRTFKGLYFANICNLEIIVALTTKAKESQMDHPRISQNPEIMVANRSSKALVLQSS